MHISDLAVEYQVQRFAPSLCTFPTTLYRLLKKVYQSPSVFFAVSSKSSHSGRQSSGFKDDKPKALFGSLPVKTKSHRQYSSTSSLASCFGECKPLVAKQPRSNYIQGITVALPKATYHDKFCLVRMKYYP
jgi:hypothetical protein